MNNFGKISITTLIIISLLLNLWFFAGWPAIWQNSIVPLKLREVHAAQVTIDSSVNTTTTSHLGSSPTTVFINQNTGYAFYRDSTGVCAYSKTTNGGTTWGAAVTVDSQTDCLQIAVWYDQWTPGDSGNLIHIATIDSGDDDIWYRYLDTSNDTLSTGPINITSGLGYSGTLVNAANYTTIAKATDGALFAAVMDSNGTGNIMPRCTTNCTTATNWSAANPTSWTAGNDFGILIPRLSGEMMFIWWDTSLSSNDLKYSRYTGSWSTWANIDTALDNGTYDASFGAAVDPSNGDVYLAYAAQAATLGTDDDIRVRRFNGTSWATLTDVVTNSVCAGVSNCGITKAKIARDSNTGYLYVLYSAQSTPGTAATANVYWKYSTDGGSTWSSEFGPVYSTNDDIYGARLSLMSTSTQRIYATWYAATPDDLFGRPIAPKTFQQSAYRFFENADSTDVGSPLAAQDTAATLSSTGQAFRLRMLLHVGVSDLFTNEGVFKLQFAQRGADNQCDTSFSDEIYTDVTTSTVIAYKDNTTPTDNTALTNNANDPTHNGDTIINQTYEESNNFTNSVGVISSGQDGKWDFSLRDNGASANTAYCLRIVKSDGTTLDNYTTIPQITTATGGTLTGDIVDGSYNSVSNPTMTMNAVTFSFSCQTATGTFGTSSQRIYVNNNNGASDGWTLTIATTDGPTALWSAGTPKYDFNDPTSSGCTDGGDADSYGGQMTINPSVATLTVGQCSSCSTNNVSKGTSASFVQGTTDSITLLSATAASDDVGDWVLTGVTISQTIPAEQAVNTYSINLTLTVTAN